MAVIDGGGGQRRHRQLLCDKRFKFLFLLADMLAFSYLFRIPFCIGVRVFAVPSSCVVSLYCRLPECLCLV